MLEALGCPSLDALVAEAVPAAIRLRRPLNLPAARSEQEALAALKEIASQNQVFRSFIGMGYSDCITPAVLQRNLLENPGGTPHTLRTRLRSPRAGSRRCSTSRPWSLI